MKLKTIFAGVVAAIFPLVSLAHEGHGTWGSYAHELDHLAWLAAGVVFALGLAYAGFRLLATREQRDEDSQD